MNKRRQYHKSNCDSTVRAIVTDPLGRKVILVGKHAFEWSIILEKEGRLVITTFPKREQAVDTFNKNVGKEDTFGRTSKFALNTDGAVYAIELCNRYYATLGGLHINSDMQVLNKNQEAVEGLYASGEVVGGLEGDIYYPGSLFSWAITSGHNAGLSVSK